MTKADTLRKIFPDFVGHPSIEIWDNKVVCFLNVPQNIIEVMFKFIEPCGCCHDTDVDKTTLDDFEGGVNSFDDDEFELLIEGLNK